MARGDTPVRLGGIPSEYQDGFVKLLRLDDAQVQKLSAAFRKVPPTMDIDNMTSALIREIDFIPGDDVADIVLALLPLSTLRADLDTSVSGMAAAVISAMDRTGTEKLELTGEDRERLERLLTELLSSPSLEVAGKARSLQMEDEHVFQEARIVTDIRPVFGASPEDRPGGAVIIHKLKLSYLENSQLKDFFVAMDARDIRVLRELFERADLKAKSLKAVLEDADVPHVDVRERNP